MRKLGDLKWERERDGLDKNKDIKHFRDLLVYRRAFKAAMIIFQLTKEFPSEEKYSLTFFY